MASQLPKKPKAKALKTPPVVKRQGIPSSLTPAQRRVLALRIFDYLESGITLRQALKLEAAAPTAPNFLRWIREDDDLKKRYADARLVGYLAMADDIVDISDETHVVAEYQGQTVRLDISPTGVAHNRLRTDVRKWLLSKCLPKMFGDRAIVATEDGDALSEALKAIAAKLPV